MSEIEEIFVGGVSHHICLLDLSIYLLRLDINCISKIDSLNDLIPSSSQDFNIKTYEYIAEKGILNVLYLDRYYINVDIRRLEFLNLFALD